MYELYMIYNLQLKLLNLSLRGLWLWCLTPRPLSTRFQLYHEFPKLSKKLFIRPLPLLSGYRFQMEWKNKMFMRSQPPLLYEGVDRGCTLSHLPPPSLFTVRPLLYGHFPYKKRELMYTKFAYLCMWLTKKKTSFCILN